MILKPLLLLFFLIFALNAETYRIMPLGDSITSGITTNLDSDIPSLRSGYRAPLYYQLVDSNFSVDFVGSLKTGTSVSPAFDVDNEGHPGWTSYNIAERVFGYLSDYSPDVILLHVGTNDNTTSVDGVISLLNEVDRYENMSGKPIRVIVSTLISELTNEDLVVSFNNNLTKMVEKRREEGDILTLVDMYRTAGLTPDDYAGYLHPNNTGYTKIAKVWYNILTTPYAPPSTAPVTKDDKINALTGSTVTINILQNDLDYQHDMDITSVRFSNDKTSITIENEGTWHVNNDGIVTFKSEKNFFADPSPISYTVKDLEGTISKPANIYITYTNTSLENFPTSLVNQIYIEAIDLDKITNSITFITRVPNTGITF